MAIVSLIGAGPGDPELMTRKAWRILGEADVVLHDALMDVEGMKGAGPQARWISVGKRAGQPAPEQVFICKTMVAYARRGLRVVRLKGGDPSLFGRVTEELDACREAGLEVEVVPGVTSACAAAADLQAGLTMRGVARSVVFVTPRLGRSEHEPSDDHWLKAALAADTAVLYMAGKRADAVCRKLMEAGKHPLTPICVVENAGGTGLRLQSTLSELARHGLPALQGPVSLLLGDALSVARHTQSYLEMEAEENVQSRCL
ncbi:MAG TPA: uroporphyrinogen-III C-methyltransferase [Burkholderiaceae bacterium]|nr:uroporphyrinogen-III C-methyltransferase [Burkholderiaceae bacterium]